MATELNLKKLLTDMKANEMKEVLKSDGGDDFNEGIFEGRVQILDELLRVLYGEKESHES